MRSRSLEEIEVESRSLFPRDFGGARTCRTVRGLVGRSPLGNAGVRRWSCWHRWWLLSDQWLRSSWSEFRLSSYLPMTLAHLNEAEARAEVSPRVPPLMAIRDKFARALREES